MNCSSRSRSRRAARHFRFWSVTRRCQLPRHQIRPHAAVSLASRTGDSYWPRQPTPTKAEQLSLIARGGIHLIAAAQQTKRSVPRSIAKEAYRGRRWLLNRSVPCRQFQLRRCQACGAGVTAKAVIEGELQMTSRAAVWQNAQTLRCRAVEISVRLRVAAQAFESARRFHGNAVMVTDAAGAPPAYPRAGCHRRR